MNFHYFTDAPASHTRELLGIRAKQDTKLEAPLEKSYYYAKCVTQNA